MTRPIVLLAVEGESSRIVFHALARRFGDVIAVVEPTVPRRQVMARRVRRIGLMFTVGQALFRVLLYPALVRRGRARVEELVSMHGFDRGPIPLERRHDVSSVNTPETRARLQALNPRLVVVNGTRILGPETLGSVGVPFVNMHVGITPSYRGVAGGWWALAEGRPDLAGTTVHLVDKGIDTGAVLKQGVFQVTSRDNAATYNYLHLAVGVPLLLEAVEELLQGTVTPKLVASDVPSKLRYQFTIWDYVRARLVHKVR